jgi:hypothetical protein
MLLCHCGGPWSRGDLAQLLAPGLGDGIARLMLGRSAYTSAEEQDAEVMASLFLERATRPAAWPPRTQSEITAVPDPPEHERGLGRSRDRTRTWAPLAVQFMATKFVGIVMSSERPAGLVARCAVRSALPRCQPTHLSDEGPAHADALQSSRRYVQNIHVSRVRLRPMVSPAGTAAAAILALLRWGRQWRSYRQLHPLWSALRLAVPQIALAPPRGTRHHIGFRLYRRVIEIRDGELALRPYRDPTVADAATAAAAEAGLTGDALNTVVQATILATALQAKHAGQRARHNIACTSALSVPGPDPHTLHCETAWLLQLSRAFGHSPLVRYLGHGEPETSRSRRRVFKSDR